MFDSVVLRRSSMGEPEVSRSPRLLRELRAFGHREPELLAQRRPGVVGVEESAALQLRDEQIDNPLESERQRRHDDVEPVTGPGTKPVLRCGGCR